MCAEIRFIDDGAAFVMVAAERERALKSRVEGVRGLGKRHTVRTKSQTGESRCDKIELAITASQK